MKFIKYSLYSLCISLLAISCADEPLPFETFEDLQKGAFSRLLSTNNGSFFFTDPDNSAFTFNVEYYSENNGGEVAANEWFVRHRNNVTGDVSEPVLLSRLEASQFGTDEKSGLPTGSFAFDLNAALSALGITIDDVNGGDDMIFDGYVVLKDGRRFGPDNTGGAVQGGAGFDGIFRFIKPLLCVSNLEGTYDVVTTVTSQGAGIGWDNCAGNTYEGTVKIVQYDPEGAPGQYAFYTPTGADGAELNDASIGAYNMCYGTTEQGTLPCNSADICIYVTDACNKLSISGSSQWGEAYTITEVSVDGANLTYAWTNDYGEGASSVITRTDGTSWPALKN